MYINIYTNISVIIKKKIIHCLIKDFLTFWICILFHLELRKTFPKTAKVESILLFRSKKNFKKLYILLKVRELFQYEDR